MEFCGDVVPPVQAELLLRMDGQDCIHHPDYVIKPVRKPVPFGTNEYTGEAPLSQMK